VSSTSTNKLFISNQIEAIKRFTELDNDLKAKKNQTFKEWHDRKVTEKSEQALRKRAEEELKAQAKAKKIKKAEIVFKKWLKLRSKNQYVSKSLNGKKQVKIVPNVSKVDHNSRYSQSLPPSSLTHPLTHSLTGGTRT